MQSTEKHILLVSQYFYPEMISTGHILTELLVELGRTDIDATVISAQPTYYSQEKVEKEINYRNIRIKRTCNTQFGKDSRLGRTLNSLSFFMGALWLTLTDKNQGPIFLVTNPPFLGLIGVICRTIKARSFILIVHDVYPDIAVSLGYFSYGSIPARIWRRINQLIYRLASFIVVLGRDMQKIISDQVPPEEQEKIKIIPNWADPELIYPLDIRENNFVTGLGLQGKLIVQYSGNMGLTHDLESVIEAASDLSVYEDIYFLIIGGGGKLCKIKEMARKSRLKNIQFLPYQSRESLAFSLGASHLSLISLEEGIEGLSVPSKLYGILASGRPVIASVSDNSEVALTVNENQCGIVIPPKDHGALVNAILRLRNNEDERHDMGRRAHQAFLDNYTVERCAKKYRGLIDELMITTKDSP